MTASGREIRGTVVPTLRYADVPAAIEWLCTAFGFARHLVVNGEEGSVRYAQLAFGDGLIMLGATDEWDADRLMAQPNETGGYETQICYLFVEDARAHCARAKAAGAEIVLDIDDEASDGRGYSCRDPQGHIWNFGTYDPRQRQSVRGGTRGPARHPPGLMQKGVRRLALAVGMLANAVGSIAFIGWVLGATQHTLSVAYAGVPAAHADAREEPAAGAALERAVREARDQLSRERASREAAERTARDAREQLVRERTAKDAAERAMLEAREQLARERTARASAEPEAGAALRKAEQQAAEALERARDLERVAHKAREEAAAERSAREAAERAAKQARELAKSAPKRAAPKPKAATTSSSLWQ